jgi:hypothetical protein
MLIKEERESKTHVDACAAVRYRIFVAQPPFAWLECAVVQKASRKAQLTLGRIKTHGVSAN